MTRRTICIIAFSPIARDARVLRQIKYLSRQYDLIVIGQGAAPDEWADSAAVTWRRVDIRRRRALGLLRLPLLFLSRFNARLFDAWYWSSLAHRDAYAAAEQAAPDDLAAIHANDWNTLPIALRLARRRGAKVVLDLHEYAPLEFEHRLVWRLVFPAAIRGLLRRSAALVAASITVAPGIAERYRHELGFDPIVILNAPEVVEHHDHPIDPGRIRFIHHGSAQRGRQLELIVDAIALSGPHVEVQFMLVGDPSYIAELRRRASHVAAGRIRFREPVAPDEIADALAPSDLGIYLLAPTGYNEAQALPNKLFDFIGAGLAVLVGPNTAMAAFVREHGIGRVASSLDPSAIAEEIRTLTPAELEDMRSASRSIRRTVNAATEMAKLQALYRRLLT